MSAGKATPGPWKVITEQTAREVDVFEVAEVSHFRVIPDRSNTWETQGDAFADASLIAAAPALLEALKDLFGADMERVLMGDGKDDQIAAIAKARAAIALAGGEG